MDIRWQYREIEVSITVASKMLIRELLFLQIICQIKSVISLEPPEYCASTKIRNRTFAPLYGVPIFASNQILANYEAKSIFELAGWGEQVEIIRFYQYTVDCLQQLNSKFYYSQSSSPNPLNVDYVADCTETTIYGPRLPTSSAYMADDQSYPFDGMQRIRYGHNGHCCLFCAWRGIQFKNGVGNISCCSKHFAISFV